MYNILDLLYKYYHLFLGKDIRKAIFNNSREDKYYIKIQKL